MPDQLDDLPLDDDDTDGKARKKSGGGSDTRGFKMVFARLAQFMSKGQFRLALRGPKAQPAPTPENAPTLDY